MAWVTPVVEVAFGDAPYATSPTYTDVSAYVIGEIAIRQGRRTEFDDPEVGTLSVTFNNVDRRFDPTYSAGPYYGDLKQNVRIRVRASGSDLFTGWVKGWPQSLDHRNGMATVTIQAVDALGMLANTALAATPLQAAILANDPVGYWPLNDVTDRTALDLSGNDNHGLVERHPSFPGSPKLVDTDIPLGQGKAWYPESSVGLKLPPVFDGITPKRYQAFCMWIRTPRPTNTNPDGSFVAMPLTLPRMLLGVKDSGSGSNIYELATIYAASYGLGVRMDGVAYVLNDDQTFQDYVWHFLFVSVDSSSGGVRIIVDDNSYSSTSTPAGDGFWNTPLTATEYRIGTGSSSVVSYSSLTLTELSNVAFFHSDSSTLHDGTVARQIWDAAQGWAGDTEEQRLAHVLAVAGWPSTMGDAVYVGGPTDTRDALESTALAELQRLTRMDGSAVLGLRNGNVWLRGRNYLLAFTSSQVAQAEFGDDAAYTYRYSDVQPALDVDHIYNIVRVQRDGGEPILIHDRASIDEYGPHSIEIDGAFSTDLEAAQFARWFIDRYSAPTVRLDRLEVNARYSTQVLNKVIGLWLGDMIEVNITPLGVGSEQTYTQWIESVEHRINVSDLTWFTTYTTSPATVQSPALFKLNTSTLGPSGTDVLAQ